MKLEVTAALVLCQEEELAVVATVTYNVGHYRRRQHFHLTLAVAVVSASAHAL